MARLCAGGILAALAACIVAGAYGAEGDAPTVVTTHGPVFGRRNSTSGVDVFMGIPYAAPPLGARRFRPPQAPVAWSEPRNCTTPASFCAQKHFTTKTLTGSEDCLYLDVFAPAAAAAAGNASLPVLAWIHGGGDIVGDAEGGPIGGSFDGQHLASTFQMVVVTLQYRLNVFGYLALEAFAREQQQEAEAAMDYKRRQGQGPGTRGAAAALPGSVGNFAIQDQRLALEWVRDNVARFGGDPAHVLLAGQSAGGVSVCAHLTTPGSAGLFSAAAVQSGLCGTPNFFADRDVATNFGLRYAGSRQVGCPIDGGDAALLDCLRSKSTLEVMNGFFIPRIELHNPPSAPPLPVLLPVMPWAVAVDGAPTLNNNGVEGRPLDMVARGRFQDVPLLIGTNRNEMSLFLLAVPVLVAGVGLPISDEGLDRVLEHFFQHNRTVVDAVKAAYPRASYGSNDALVEAAVRDYWFACPSRALLDGIQRARPAHAPHFLYRFNKTQESAEGRLFGDFHGAEIPYVFGNGKAWWQTSDRDLSASMSRFWYHLAHSAHSPGSSPGSGLVWPAYNASSRLNMVLDAPLAVEHNLSGKQCDFWDSIIGYNY